MRRVNCKKLTSFLFVCAYAYTLLDGILYLAMRYYTSYLDLYPNLTAPPFNSPVRFFRPSREHEQEGSYYDHRWLLIFRSRNTIFVLNQFILFLRKSAVTKIRFRRLSSSFSFFSFFKSQHHSLKGRFVESEDVDIYIGWPETEVTRTATVIHSN